MTRSNCLASDADVGRLRPVVAKIRAALLSGESFAEALADHPALFPPMYVALVRVGEVSGTLDQVLEVLAAERARSEAMRRKLGDAMHYPAFVLVAAGCVHAVLPSVRAAAIFIGAAGFRRQVDPTARLSSSGCRTSCAPMPSRSDAASLLLRSPAPGGCCAGRSRAAAIMTVVSRLPRHRRRFSTSIAPVCSAGISASCSAAAST